jgi:energy-coupling factor transporter ATP-binding protein EcfA2
MYLESTTITNIKCFEEITLDFKASRTNEPNYDPQQNWNVILGDNGEGKSTLLQAIASPLMDGATVLRVTNLSKWGRYGEPNGNINIAIIREADDFLSPESQLAKALPVMGKLELAWNFRFGGTLWAPDSGSFISLYQRKKKGWVSCGYGPFRRLYGPLPQVSHSRDPLEERFLTLFDERAALYQCEAWLKDLERLALRHGTSSPQQKTFEDIKQLIVELLPNIDEVHFRLRASSLLLRAARRS